MRKIDPLLHERLIKLISSMGYEMFGDEILSQGGQSIFRIFIDAQDKQSNVTIEDCSIVSQQVSAMLDVENSMGGHYTLEVSSPGINRPLFKLDHYRRYIGSRVKVQLHIPINQRRQFKGLLYKVDDECIYLLLDELKEEVKLR